MIIERGQLGEAHFSECRTYRYLLTRGTTGAGVTFVMLNPSTADHDQNDPTIAKCLAFAKRFAWEDEWPAHQVAIVNLFAVRATDPRDCFRNPKPVGGPLNDQVILDTCQKSNLVIAAWGSHPKSAVRAAEVRRYLVTAGVKLHRLGQPTKDGSPRHPLYLAGDTALELWT